MNAKQREGEGWSERKNIIMKVFAPKFDWCAYKLYVVLFERMFVMMAA